MKITNTREHDITITALDNDGNPGSVTIPAARRSLVDVNKLESTPVEIDESLFKSALAKNPAVQAMLDEGWLLSNAKAAEAKK